MKVSDILRVKGNTLYTVTPDTPVLVAITTMAEHDIGSLVVMDKGELIGILTFRELLKTIAEQLAQINNKRVGQVMNDHPMTCTPQTDVHEVRRMILNHHARYLPVLDAGVLMGVISFYDVAKAVVDEQGFENKMLKAYIRDWPTEKNS